MNLEQSRPGSLPQRASRDAFRDPALLILLVFGLLVRAAMLRDYVVSNPGAGSVGGDAGVYWDTAAHIADGQLIGDEPFLLVPLYPYLLAGVRAAGGGLAAVYALQLCLHLLTAAAIAVLATRKFDRATGLLAAAVFLVAEEPAFLSTRLLPSTLQLLLVTLALLAAERCHARVTGRNAVLVGLLTGLLALIYPPALALVAVAGLWLWRRGRDESRDGASAAASRRGRAAVLGALGLAAGLAAVVPATLHNWAACGELIPLTGHAGITLCQGNTPGAEGVYTRIEGVSTFRNTMHRDAARVYARETGEQGGYAAVDRFFLLRGVSYLTADFGRAIRLTARKLYWFLTGRHYADIYFPTLEQRDGWLHLLPLAPLPTAWLLGPAAAGLWLGWRSGRFHGFDLAQVLLPMVVVALFWYSPRYRLPVLPLACVATAAAVLGAVRSRWGPGRDWKSAAGVAGLFAASAALGAVNAAVGFDLPGQFRPQYELNRGQDLARLGAYDLALEHLIEAERLLPGQPAVLAATAGALIELNRLDEAERVIRGLLEIEPASVTGRLLAGSMHLRRGQPADAEAFFSEALALDDREPEAHLGMWLAHSAQGRGEEGVAHLRAAVELDPTNAVALGEYGIGLAEQGEPARAEPYLRRSVRQAPDRPKTHFNLGEVLAELGRSDEAVTCFERALFLDPSYAPARRRLAALQREAASEQPSMDDLQRMIDQAPKESGHYSRLAGQLYAHGDVAGAVAVLRRAVDRVEDRTTVALELAWLLATVSDDALRDGAEAVQLARTVVDSSADPSPQSLDVLAAALAEAGRFAEAVASARRAVEAAEAAGDDELAALIGGRLALYRDGQPYRQP